MGHARSVERVRRELRASNRRRARPTRSVSARPVRPGDCSAARPLKRDRGALESAPAIAVFAARFPSSVRSAAALHLAKREGKDFVYVSDVGTRFN
jgi:hypothetical protein